MSEFFEIDSRVEQLAESVMPKLAGAFAGVDQISEENQHRVLAAFIRHRVSERHFAETTGYGYNDQGRDTLDEVFADCFGAEDALVRHNFICGTHAIATALFALLRPGDRLLSVTGRPYDTLHSTLGLREAPGSLKEYGVLYDEVSLTLEGKVDYAALEEYLLKKDVRVVYIQRSRGYTLRPALRVADIAEIVRLTRACRPEALVAVDNCYGEFVETTEPSDVGADLIMGSLIKNPGGGIARSGGYIAGRADLVELCAARMCVPGIGREAGASLGFNRELYMGLFHAPHIVGEALKTALFAAALLKEMGYAVSPDPEDARGDIVQSVIFGSAGKLAAFCRGIQSGAPVDAFVSPEPAPMPGYDHQIIMSAGAFTMGSSIELSADGPLREPYAAFLQGGLNFASGKAAVMLAAGRILEDGSAVL